MNLMSWLRAVKRRLPEFSRRLFKFAPAVCAAILLGSVLAAFSLWCAHKHGNYFEWFAVSSLRFYAGVVVGVMVALILIPFAASGPARYAIPFVHAARSWVFPLFLVFTLLFVPLFLLLAEKLEPVPGASSWLSFLKLANTNPGGWFIIITGMATLLGVWYTWRGLAEIKQTVTSFSDLIDRVCDMARKKASSENPVRILSYTPAVGYLAQPSRDWHLFCSALTQKPDGKPIVEIVCLRSEDLHVWHSLFVDRQTLQGKIKKTTTDEATTAAETFLQTISKDDTGKAVDPCPVWRLPWRFMPGFYLFFTRERAIIVTPLFLPFPKGAPKQQQEDLPSVQMIGLDTQDRAIIRDIEEVFFYYKNLPQRPIAEAGADISSADLVDCCANKEKLEGVMNQLRDRLIESLKDSGFSRDGNESAQINLVVDAYLKTW
jgi:hypothetical protein